MDDLQDATRAPSPEGGWSTRMVSLADAVVVPSSDISMIQPCGVFDATGAYCHNAVLWRDRPLMVPPARPETHDHLPGRWLWGGVLLNHFGHFLTESLGRLWALDAIAGDIDGIVFVLKREAVDEAEILKEFQKTYFDLLGVKVPFSVIARPTRVDLLEVPGQGFGIGPLAPGTEPFRRFVQSRFAKDVAAEGPKKLYVSRSELAAIRGGILEEARLESYLADCGYEIFHPQKHPLPVQIARYKAADQVVALDGSALHLFAMVANADQRVAIIKRRDSGATDSIVRHISSFAGRAPLVIDTILQDWIRSDRSRADRMSFGELDFRALGDALMAAGFIAPGTAWMSLTPEESSAAVRRIEGRLKRKKLTFQPVSRSGGEVGAAKVAKAARPDKTQPEKMTPRRAARIAGRKAARAARGK